MFSEGVKILQKNSEVALYTVSVYTSIYGICQFLKLTLLDINVYTFLKTP